MGDVAPIPERPARDRSGDEESDVSGGSTGDNAKAGGRQRLAKRPRARSNSGTGAGRAPRSHVATEQRRRDRINDGFDQLRDLIPHKDKLDKAAFLQKTIDYICQLQGVLQQLLDMGVVSQLSEDLQWNIRMLLPRVQPGGRPIGMRPDGTPPSRHFGAGGPACAPIVQHQPPPPQQQQQQHQIAPQAMQIPQVQQQQPQAAAPDTNVQMQYLQTMLSSVPPSQLSALLAGVIASPQQQQQPQPVPQPQAPEPVRVANPWAAQLAAASAAPTSLGGIDPANFQQLAAWFNASNAQAQQQQPQQSGAGAQTGCAAPQVSNDSGSNATIPSWNPLMQLAGVLQQQNAGRTATPQQGTASGFQKLASNNQS